MSDIFKVWVDNSADQNQGHYLINNTILANYEPRLERIFPNNTKSFARNPRRIQELLYLDKPDVIITHQRSASDIEQPVLAVEFSEQTPMGQNAYQRFPRAVASAESSVPFVIVFPSRDWVPRERRGTSGWDHASPFIFNGLRKLTDFHELPALAVDWPFDEEADPIRGYKCYDDEYANLPDSGSTEARELFSIVDIVLENTIDRGSPQDLFRNRTVMARIDDLDERRMGRGAKFLKSPPPASGSYLPTQELVVGQPDRDACYSGSRVITFTLGGDESEILRDPPQRGRTGRIDQLGRDRTGGRLPAAECADPAVGRPGGTRTWTTRH